MWVTLNTINNTADAQSWHRNNELTPWCRVFFTWDTIAKVDGSYMVIIIIQVATSLRIWNTQSIKYGWHIQIEVIATFFMIFGVRIITKSLCSLSGHMDFPQLCWLLLNDKHSKYASHMFIHYNLKLYGPHSNIKISVYWDPRLTWKSIVCAIDLQLAVKTMNFSI